MIGITKEHLDLIRHAIGYPKLYRNYFAAGPSDSEKWDQLVSMGYAVKNKRYPSEIFPDNCYHVTDEGVALVSPNKKLDDEDRVG